MSQSFRSSKFVAADGAERLRIPALRLDPQGLIAEQNSAAEELLGPVVGKPLGEAVPGAADDPMIWSATDQLVPGPVGRERWVRGSLRDQDGDRVLLLQDVSEWHDREARLRAERDMAEQALRAKMRFFAAASHDLRQPMQAIALFASALEQHVSGPQAHRILQSLTSSLASMEELFDSLLDMSRIEAGVTRAEPHPVFVNDLLEALEAEFANQVAAKHLELRLVPSSATVLSDPTHLARILRNLLANSVRYTDHGKILVGCRRRGGHLRIEVWDTGLGIPDDQRQAIFEEFVQGKTAHAEKGLGLGLAIVKGLSRLLDHRLDLHSEPGRGSMFAVSVPLLDEDDTGLDVEDEEAGLMADLHGITVAVIDDDPDVLEGLRVLLESWGCNVAPGGTGEETWAAIERAGGQADVILADLRLRTGGSGVAAVEYLHQRGTDSVPAFVLTGDTDIASETGGYPVLFKPINPLRLRRVLAEAAGRA